MSLKDIFDKTREQIDSPSVHGIIVPQLVRHLEKSREARRKLYSYHASQLYNLCPREEALTDFFLEKGKKFKESLPASLRLTFDTGHALHDWFRNEYLREIGGLEGIWKCSLCGNLKEGVDLWFSDCPCSVPTHKVKREYVEPSFQDKINGVTGSIDGILAEDTVTRRPRMILELKTINLEGFRKLTKPFPAHVFQIQVYMWLSGIRHAVIVYISKGHTGAEPPFKEFTVEYEEGFLDETFISLDSVRSAKDRKDPLCAKKVCLSSSTPRGKNCPYRDICFKKAPLEGWKPE